VHGNVSEWVNDYYSSVYYTSNPIEDPEGPSSGTARVVRGGYYNASAAECRSSARGSQQANSAIANVGIRVARADSEQCQQAEATNVSSAPPGRLAPELVWTGHEVLVLGGEPSSSSIGLPAFSPFENEWSIASGLNAPELDRIGHGVAWTGEEALIWGGERLNMVISDGGAYHESKDLWRSMISNLKSPSPRSHFAHHWLGTQWFIWGGKDDQQALSDGARYVPSEDTWLPVSRSPLSARQSTAAVWTSTTVMVIGGIDGNNQALSDYAFYDPHLDSWSEAFAMPGCSGKLEAYVLSGHVVVISENGWCRYELATGIWSTMPNRPNGHIMFSPGDGVAVTNEAELLVYGGSVTLNDATVDAYEPKLNRWRSVYTGNSPDSVSLKSKGIWAGCRFFIWSDHTSRQTGWILGW